ncbi:MAG TPA: DinB family protein, partial [Gemmatimonadales bacterium]
DLAWTFVFEGIAGAQAVQGEMKFPPPNMPAMPANWQGVVGEVEKALRSFGDKVRKADESQLNATVKFKTGPKQVSDLRRLDVLWFMLNDQIHHRGQLSVYLRMTGAKVPSIYGPSKDEPWQ